MTTRITAKEKQVLDTIIEGLYAEPGFSDVEAGDIIAKTGLKKEAVAALIGSLLEKKVIWTDEFEANFETRYFIQLSDEFYHLHPSDEYESDTQTQVEFV